MHHFDQKELEHLYLYEQKSAAEIAVIFECSTGRINYWLRRFDIPKRSRSEAVYARKNRGKDPFRFSHPSSFEDMFLFGLGLGLYWSGGVRRNPYIVRFSSADSEAVRMFRLFLERICGVDSARIKQTRAQIPGRSRTVTTITVNNKKLHDLLCLKIENI